MSKNFIFKEELMSLHAPAEITSHAFGSLGFKYHNGGEGWRLLDVFIHYKHKTMRSEYKERMGNILEDIKKVYGEDALPSYFKEDVIALCQEVLEERIPKGIYGKKEDSRALGEHKQLYVSQATSTAGLVYDIRIVTDRESGEPLVCQIRFKENREDIRLLVKETLGSGKTVSYVCRPEGFIKKVFANNSEYLEVFAEDFAQFMTNIVMDKSERFHVFGIQLRKYEVRATSNLPEIENFMDQED